MPVSIGLVPRRVVLQWGRGLVKPAVMQGLAADHAARLVSASIASKTCWWLEKRSRDVHDCTHAVQTAWRAAAAMSNRSFSVVGLAFPYKSRITACFNQSEIHLARGPLLCPRIAQFETGLIKDPRLCISVPGTPSSVAVFHFHAAMGRACQRTGKYRIRAWVVVQHEA